MTTLAELIAQKEELEKRITEIRKEERSKAVSDVRALILSFELTADELFGKKQKAMKPTGSVAKYRDPESGKTWSGKGRAPLWLDGKNRDDFVV